MLELKDLCFSVPGDGKRIDILDHIDLTVPDGKLVVITGPNGSGKSTLARVIMGIEKATAGSIVFNGEAVEQLNVTERARRGISYGFQQPPRFKGMKVCDLLECAAGRKLTLDESCHYLAQVGLCSQEYVERDVDASLSGGERRRGAQLRRESIPVFHRQQSAHLFRVPLQPQQQTALRFGQRRR